MEKCCFRLYLDAFAIVKVNVLAIDQLFRWFAKKETGLTTLKMRSR